MTRQCCVCKRVHVDGRWVIPAWDVRADKDVTHGYCERCFEDFVRSLGGAYLTARLARLGAEAAR